MCLANGKFWKIIRWRPQRCKEVHRNPPFCLDWALRGENIVRTGKTYPHN